MADDYSELDDLFRSAAERSEAAGAPARVAPRHPSGDDATSDAP